MKRLVLIVSGSIAAYKAMDLASLLRKAGWEITPVLTRAAAEFISPLSLEIMCGTPAASDLFGPASGRVEHIALDRDADLILVVPATANLLAKMAAGIADDLASCLLLGSTAPVLAAPAMNGKMWMHPATRQNVQTLKERGVRFIDPVEGPLACGETDIGRLAPLEAIVAAVKGSSNAASLPLLGKKALVTAGPTREALDPVRYVGNHSSGKQGFAIAEALAKAGADVTLVSGPVSLPTPAGVRRIDVVTALEMEKAALAALPVDIVVGCAAVADWRPEQAAFHKLKKKGAASPFPKKWVENPDILKELSQASRGKALIIGFAAETENLPRSAVEKRLRKGCDWMLGNEVDQGVFNGDQNRILFCSENETRQWPRMSKQEVALRLVKQIEEKLAVTSSVKKLKK